MACYEQWCSHCKKWVRHCDGVCGQCGQLEEVSLIDAAEEKDTYREEVASEQKTKVG